MTFLRPTLLTLACLFAAHTGASDLPSLGDATVAVRGGREADPSSGAILTPIVQSTTYVQEGVGRHKGYTYSRASNPTVAALERALAAFEAGRDGGARSHEAIAFSSGMSAISTLALATLRAGDEVIVSEVVYGGTVRLVQRVLEPLGVAARFVDTADLAAVGSAVSGRTRLIFIETPANPTLRLTDIGGVAKIARQAGALLAVDNTFLTPAITRPIDHGADVAVYSTTKHIEGHNATIGGALVVNNPELAERLRLIRKTLGAIQSPFEAWLTLRGLKTLPLRIREHSKNASVIARFLEQHPGVERVNYPGLAGFPQAQLAWRQHRLPSSDRALHGGILSFEVKGGVEAGVRVLEGVRIPSLAENLGAVESLITHPVTMTHGDVPREQRERAGITDGLIRLSVGLEDPLDLIDDLDRAIDAAVRGDRAAVSISTSPAAAAAVLSGPEVAHV
ncbi:MAG: aminotransferase class I/II-fold pyridoxal phosphate-dependent enzyme [Phycisphaerales bacterium]|nr:aminotransferase class I/II-fold pyridoxal phosphate-dependent enzyme [Phycisphaerales bacterium]